MSILLAKVAGAVVGCGTFCTAGAYIGTNGFGGGGRAHLSSKESAPKKPHIEHKDLEGTDTSPFKNFSTFCEHINRCQNKTGGASYLDCGFKCTDAFTNDLQAIDQCNKSQNYEPHKH
ncbi:hypothetical protein MHLP_02515 [Candidatus Mycoplasma haematolamae str. Purdue]|uniref:Uncharacterized protein n=1 Tax=Mycoplasma haematolamae (strain Purdue) TaxID=1212765 RepID=I7BJN9_MYCHA|nr:hypothetical protein [Candidatus Mycoplasma haematolamae]AFO52083.1 hypothetical protein MHLP_02515 [Candidatus Mycoplasma haematolamae str. Purdue]